MRKEDWIPVNKLPEQIFYKGEPTGVSHHVLVTNGKTQWVAYCSFFEGEDNTWTLAHGEYTEGLASGKVTHWMPLPEKP